VTAGGGPGGRPTLVVDGNNVIGSVPDGWWRDRPAAVRRLLGRLRCLAATPGASAAVLVLDVPQPDLPEGDHGGVAVHYARRRGRDAADDRIVDLLDAAAAGDAIEVVTSDRDLAARAADRGARVTGARAFLDALDRAGC
jgi:predicted RNA-binding protein with PIN domain